MCYLDRTFLMLLTDWAGLNLLSVRLCCTLFSPHAHSLHIFLAALSIFSLQTLLYITRHAMKDCPPATRDDDGRASRKEKPC